MTFAKSWSTTVDKWKMFDILDPNTVAIVFENSPKQALPWLAKNITTGYQKFANPRGRIRIPVKLGDSVFVTLPFRYRGPLHLKCYIQKKTPTYKKQKPKPKPTFKRYAKGNPKFSQWARGRNTQNRLYLY